MLKKIKFFMLIIAVALAFFVFAGTSVNAAYIETAEDVEAFFEGAAVEITANKTTLTGDVELTDLAEWMLEGNYTIDLNGHVLEIPELYVSSLDEESSVKLEIIDSSSNNGIIKANMIEAYENCTLYLCNAQAKYGINNSGTLTIEYAEAASISQFGVATINDGKFQSLITFVDEGIKTTINGGEFTGTTTEEQNFAIMIQSDNYISEHAIDDLFADGLIADCGWFKFEEKRPDYSGCHTAMWGPTVKAMKETDAYSDVFKKITADGIWEIEALAPKGVLESESLLSAIASKIVKGTGYEATAYAYCPGEEFSADRVLVCLHKDGETEEHIVKAQYLDPAKSEKAKATSKVLNNIQYWKEEDLDSMGVKDAYILDDLYLINYLFANTGADNVKGSQALNFARELIEATGGANISFEYDSRSGSEYSNELYTHSSGVAIVCVGEEPIASRVGSLTTSHVLYVPEGEYQNEDAYIAAALKRVEDYIGKAAIKEAKFKITHGGKIDEIPEVGDKYNEKGLLDDANPGDNYYVVEINGKVYNFVICEEEANKLKTPKYVGMNLGSNITITTDSKSVPLDTAITAKSTIKDSIKKALGTDLYAAYDITLYSAAKDEQITKIQDGEFVVSIPVPDNLKGIDEKDLTVYYVNEKGEKEEKNVTELKNGIISFETDHFSTYVLAKRVNEVNNPNTSDNVLIAVVTLMLSMAGVVVAAKCIKK